MLEPASVHGVLLDIEGTTTPIRFVYDVLFPHAERNLETFLRRHFREDSVRINIADLYAQRSQDEKSGQQLPEWNSDSEQNEIESLCRYVKWLMSRDSKASALKALQGTIWEEGYLSGELQGDVFEDVPGALARWRHQAKKTAIYSSGSVLAQKLLFRHSNCGDLIPLLDAFFDTGVGIKSDPISYRKIAESLALEPCSVLFLSDSPKELDAATSAGMQTALSIRPGNSPAETTGRTLIRSFDELPF